MPATFPASDPRSEQLLWDYAVLENSADDGAAQLNADLDVRFAGIVKLARILCLTPASFVSFVGDETQWLSAREGLDLRSSPRLHSFCAHAMTSAEPLVVADARADPRFAANPFVTGEPFIRFYAGAPLCSPEGVALGALCVLAVINVGIVGKERIRRDGEVVLLPLAPVDPRALLQGDYMALRFDLVREIEAASAARPERDGGVVTLALDARRVAHLATASDPGPKLPLRYRIRHGQVWLGTNAYFFEEGTAERHADARYGEFRVDPASGVAVLVGLRGADLAPR